MHRASSPVRFALLVALMAIMGLATVSATAAQDVPPANPIDLPCVSNVSAQVLAATPVDDGDRSLVLVRVILGPGGTIGNHTHPGTLAVTIESGTFGLTLVGEGHMAVKRPATDGGEATEEMLVVGEEATLNPGDSFIEMGMVHSARNLGDGQTTVLISGLITTGEPLTNCVDTASPAASSHPIRGVR